MQQPGECINIKSCSTLLSVLRYKGHAAGEFLRSSVCRYEEKEPIVCCPMIINRNEKDSRNISFEANKVPIYQSTSHGTLHPPQCGFSNVSYSRVVGGIPAELGKYKITVYHLKTEFTYFICSSSFYQPINWLTNAR